MIIGLPPKATKSYRKRVAAFAHEMVAMIENIKLKDREDARNRNNTLGSISDIGNE